MVAVINWINVALLHLMVLPVTSFPILYWWLADWRQTRQGQAVMISSFALMLLVDVSVAGRYLRFENQLVVGLVTLAVFVLIITGSVLKNVFLIKSQCQAHRDRDERAGK